MAKLLAQVGLKPITEDDVTQAILAMGPRAREYDNPRGRQIMLEQIINKELVLMDAKKNLLEHDAEFKEELEKVKDELLANFYVDKILREEKVSPEEVKAYFDEHPDEFQGEEAVSASHILVDSEEKATEIREKIEKGEITFEEAAKAFSSCPSSQQGGDLGTFGKGQMVPEFETAAFALEAGKVSEPVRTQFGFHLIRVNEKKPAQAMTFDQVKEEIGRKLLADKQRGAYESKMRQLRILYPVDRSGIL
ncbi:MAG: peptidyl-prolyl cis-trans isomerase [Clostridia bacterium]|nr:peptidyl-prolyl cis-trans isomerase [Clostridia bacterium]